MIRRFRISITVVGIAASAILPVAEAQQPDPKSPRWKGVVALSDFLTSQGDEALSQFVEHRVSRQLRDSIGRERLASVLNQLRSDFSDSELSGARPEGPFAAQIEFSNNRSISFEMEANPPHRFLRIGSIGGGKRSKGSPCNTGTAPPTNGATSFAQLDEKLRAEAAAETFSGVVLVAKDGVPIFHEAYGYADKKAGELNRKNTKFNIGSLNKLFTMVAVYQLLDAGKLSLDDTIGKYLPQFPSSVADSVTVKHLLDHRSGWAAYWDNPVWNTRRAELRSLDDYMAFIKDIPLDFEPGSRKQYSNTGYEVLGAIVQKASGRSYFDYMRDHVYVPMGMMNTDAYVRDGSTPNMAVGYAGGGYATDNLSMLSPKGTAAGGGMSTAADLMRFAKAVGEGTFVPKKCASRLRGGRFAGGGPGVSAKLYASVAGGHTIVILSNFDPSMEGGIASEIIGILRGDSAAETGDRQYRIGVGLDASGGGVVVSSLVPGGPGERGGLEPDDVITAINGNLLGDDPIAQFDAVLTKSDPVALRIRRGSEMTTITLIPELISAATGQSASSGQAPCKPGCSSPHQTGSGGSSAENLLGVVTQQPDERVARSMGLATRLRTEGRVVSEVVSGSPADRAGLKAGDVLLQLGDNLFYSRDGLNDYLKTAKPGTYPMRFKRRGGKTERTGQIQLSTTELPTTATGIRWQFSGLGQFSEALSAATSQGKRLLVGLSGSETCCPFSRFESSTVSAMLAGDEVVKLASRFVTLIIRRPHAYWFLKKVSGFDENAPFGAIPDGLKLPDGVVLPIPSVYILDSSGGAIDHIAVDGRGSGYGLEELLRRSL